MIDTKELEEIESEFAKELHAGSVYRDICAREKERSIYEKRWFWELLQNAKDSVETDKTVDIKIEITDTNISFSHTGNPFKVKEILSLIIQGSSKTNQQNKTGRFGTGFMTTYLLSKNVTIAGQLENGDQFFKFDLNRNTNGLDDDNSLKEFFKQQNNSSESFRNSIKPHSYLEEGKFQTSFVYKLDKEGKNTSEKGITSLNELIPFAQIFNNQIGSITIVKNGNTTTYEKKEIKNYKIDNNNVEEWELKSSNQNELLKAYLIKNKEFDIVCITERINDVEHLKNLNNQYPKLFFTFPLIGTEEIGIPFIINSTLFDPKIERDGIYLKSDTNTKENNDVTRNKELIKKSLELAVSVIPEIIKENNIKSEFNIFNFSKSKEQSWIDDVWFTDLKINIVNKLTEKHFIHLLERYYKYNELDIPYSHNENILDNVWKLVNDSKSYKTVPYNEQKNWITAAKNIAKLKNSDILEENNVISSSKLKQYITNKAGLTDLKNDLNNDVYKWLNKIYQFIIDDLGEFSLKNKILLNQEDNFIEAEKLKWDEVKDKDLISISNKIDLNFSNKLISNEISVFKIAGVDSLKKESAVDIIKNKLNQINEHEYQNYDKIKANVDFLKWLIINSQNNIIKELKILSIDKKEDSNIISRVFPSGKHLMLPPKNFFKKDFPKYSEIIREKDCMHQSYNDSLKSSDYETLAKWGFIHYSPLVKRKEKLDSKTIDLLIKNSNDLNSLKDDDGKLIEHIEIEYSDFAYLTSSEGHIYDRNSTTSSSLKIFDFLLNEASEKDDFFNNNSETIIINEKQIIFEKTLWMKRAKVIQWVNIKDIEFESTNKFVKETPSSKNLSELIKDNNDLIKTIRGEKQIAFLSKIKVGVSDLIRNTLKTDETKIRWDKALTTMITSDVNPELVQEIFNDPTIQNEYNKRLNVKKLIHRNQQLGSLIEELFRKLILQLKEQGIDIDIQRKPFGSDYLLSDESSDLVNDNNQEEIFSISDWLIELKATRKSYAAMTSLQAETATKKKDNYALVVVPIDGSNIDIDYIETHAKVIRKIGYKLLPVVDVFKNVESQKNKITTGHDGVSLSIEDHNVRFRVDSAVWESIDAISISEFIAINFNKQKNTKDGTIYSSCN